MNVFLGYNLGDQNCIRIHFSGFGKEFFTGNLSTHINGIKTMIAFQTVTMIITLHIHYGINTNSVSIAFNTGTDNSYFSSQMFCHIGIGFFHCHYRCLYYLYLDFADIYTGGSYGIGNKMRKTLR
ncbi:MAG: hypothetical protein BWX76_00966 [Candidatus Cloacimonetes bacterium ADurb.Bin089]|nr:MAG: hypothetical protein BWX76_00966 [Candidatus Cloacimonetes bacterium ADurb.Bin089]